MTTKTILSKIVFLLITKQTSKNLFYNYQLKKLFNENTIYSSFRLKKGNFNCHGTHRFICGSYFWQNSFLYDTKQRKRDGEGGEQDPYREGIVVLVQECLFPKNVLPFKGKDTSRQESSYVKKYLFTVNDCHSIELDLNHPLFKVQALEA